MSQSWDNEANIHKLLTKNGLNNFISLAACQVVQWACADENGMNIEPVVV